MYSHFIKNFNNQDKNVRNLNNYKFDIFKAKLSFIQNLISLQDKIYLNIILKKFKIFHKNINYKIIFFKDKSLENGYPHTINDTIMMPKEYYFSLNKKDRLELLLHEFIHIFQRQNPFHFNKFLIEKLNLEIFNIVDKEHKNRRSNPDINNLLYSYGNKYHVTIYKDNPKKISHSKIIIKTVKNKTYKQTLYEKLLKKYETSQFQIEHPYEFTACLLSYLIINNKSKEVKEIHEWLHKPI